jgi:hypothetical protein
MPATDAQAGEVPDNMLTSMVLLIPEGNVGNQIGKD